MIENRILLIVKRITVVIVSMLVSVPLLVLLLSSGPTKALDIVWNTTGPYGGQVYRIVVDPSNSSILYIATDNGVFKSVDSAQNWQQIGLPNTQVTDIKIASGTSGQVLYAVGAWGTVYRSSNGGQSWEDISANLTSQYLNAITTGTSQTGQVWVGANNGVYKWNNSSFAWELTTLVSQTLSLTTVNGVVYAGVDGGIFKSSNGGQTWQSIVGNLPTGTQQRRITSVAINPSNPLVIYVGTWYGGTYKTTNGGQHWVQINNGLPAFTEIKQIALAPSDANTIYAASYGYFNTDVSVSGIFRSTNGGSSWVPASNNLANRYAHAVAVHPGNSSNVFAGTLGNGLYRSVTSGQDWQQKVQGLASLAINALINVNGEIYVATQTDGVYKSPDGGQTWQRYNNGFPATSILAYDITSDEQGNIFVGVSRWGLFRLNGDTWLPISQQLNETEVRAILTISDTIVIASTAPDAQESTQIFVSDNQGTTWTPQNTGLPTPTLRIRSLTWQSVNSTIFAATSQGIFKAQYPLFNWASTNSGLTTNDIYQISVNPLDQNILYAAGCSYIHKSSDGGSSWQVQTNGLNSSCLYTVLVDSNNPNQIYAGGDNGVYQTINGGTFWSLTGSVNLSFGRAKDLISGSTSSLLVATSSSVWKSDSSVSSPTPTPGGSTPWTVMVYLNGDNDLDYYTDEAFNNLELAAYRNPNIKIVVLWDQMSPLGGDTVEYLVQPDNNPYAPASTYELNVNKWEHGELDLGWPGTLVNFVNDARARFPAEHYMLAIVDHGGGWSPKLASWQARPRWYLGDSGFSWDFTVPNQVPNTPPEYHYLSTLDMKTIFEQITLAGGPIDVVFYDACLMSMFEEIYQIREGAHYLVASENEAWAIFAYDDYLSGIDEDTSPRELAIHLVDTYHNSLTNYPRTMSAIDLSQANTVKNAIDNLSQAILQSLPGSQQAISMTYSMVQKLDYDYDLVLSPTEGYVDLKDFAEKLIVTMPGTNVAIAAQSLVDVLNDPSTPLVIYERHESGYFWGTGEYLNLDNAKGVSIYMPFGETDTDLPYYQDSQLEFAADTYWDNFVSSYYAQYPPQVPGGSGGGQGSNPTPILVGRRVFLPIVQR